MPLITDTPADSVVVVPDAIAPIRNTDIVRPRDGVSKYGGNVVNSKEIDHSSLLTFISGSSWHVDFYGQVLGSDQVGNTLDLSQEGAYQQYHKIINLELKVTDPLSQSQNSETSLFEVTGTAQLYPGITPNEGDVFIADVGDGRGALFSVLSVSRKTIYKESAFEITYKLIDYVNDELTTNLNDKTVEVNHFDRDRLRGGYNGLITDDDISRRVVVKKLIESLTQTYEDMFFDVESNTIAFNDPIDGLVYDPHLIKVLRKLSVNWKRLPRALNCSNVPGQRVTTLWDYITDGELYTMPFTQVMANSAVVNYATQPLLGGIAWTNIRHVRIPVEGQVEITDDVTVDMEVPMVWPSTLGGSYIVSSNFYNDTDKKSLLERYLSMWFSGKSLDTTHLIMLAEDVRSWSPLTQFYQIPILIILLQSLEV